MEEKTTGGHPMNEVKKAVVSVLGSDRKGIIAKVSGVLYENDANILDISQTIVSGLFSMILVAVAFVWGFLCLSTDSVFVYFNF